MKIMTLMFVGVVVVYLAMRLWLLPRLIRASCPADLTDGLALMRARAARAALAVSSLLAMALLCASVTGFLFATTVWVKLQPAEEAMSKVTNGMEGYLNGEDGGSAMKELSRLRHGIEHWVESVSGLASGWFILFVVGTLIGVAVHRYRRSLSGFEVFVDEMIKREHERVEREKANGELEHLPDTEAMAALMDEAKQLNMRAHQTAGEEKKRLTDEVNVIYQRYRDLDLARRVKVSFDPRQMELPPPEGFWEKVGVAFGSRGFAHGASRGMRLILVMLVGLMMPCFIAVHAHGARTALQVEAEELRDAEFSLEVIANRAAAAASYRQSLEVIKTKEPEEKPKEESKNVVDEDDDDQNLANSAAVHFETRMLRASGFEPGPDTRPFAEAAREHYSNSVRDDILRRHEAAHASVERTEFTPSQTESAKWSETTERYRHAGEAFERARANPSTPQTPSGKKIASDLATWISQAGDKARDAVKRAVASMGQSMRATDFEWAVTRGLAGMDFDAGAPGQPKGGKGPRSPAGSAERWHEAARQEAVARVVKGEPMEQVFESVSNRDRTPFVSHEEFSDVSSFMARRASAAEHADSLHAAEKARPAVRERYKAEADKLTDWIKRNPSHAEELLPATRTFSNEFPAFASDATHGLFGELMNRAASSITSNSGGSGSSAAAAARRLAEKLMSSSFVGSSLARSRSFSGLRGFSRIGGVLIGRPPEHSAQGAENLEVKDLCWVITDKGQCTLTMVPLQGGAIECGTFDSSTVNLALAYAADGRPVTVTMVQALGDDLKVLLHPTLLDTTVGEQMIHLDSWVDTYASPKGQQVAEDRIAVAYADFVYRLAWEARAFHLRQYYVKDERKSEVDARIAELMQGDSREVEPKALPAKDCQEVIDIASAKMRESPTWLRGHTPLFAKAEFYDRTLVEWIEAALLNRHDGESYADFRSKIAARMRQSMEHLETYPPTLGYLRDRSETEKLAKLLLPPPFIQPWSGVRERDYRMTTEAFQLRRPADLKGFPALSELWSRSSISLLPASLRFMVQVAFVSPPAFTDQPVEGDYVDVKPWEMTWLEAPIQASLVAALQSPGVAAVGSTAEQFTVLQRIFRCAFEGRFGLGFPLGKLSKLAEETGVGSRGFTKTNRWLRGGDLPAELETEGTENERIFRELSELLQRGRGSDGISSDDWLRLLNRRER